jgi:hypothetical protein
MIDKNKVIGMGEYFTGVKYKLYSYEKAFKSISSMKTYAIKLLADQVDFNDDQIESVLNISDKIIYLYRKDYISQVLSYISATETSSYALGFNDTRQDVVEVVVPKITEDTIKEYETLLRNNYLKMSQMFKKYPGQLVCLEDLTQKPYKNKIIWSQPVEEIKHHILDLDVVSLFRE